MCPRSDREPAKMYRSILGAQCPRPAYGGSHFMAKFAAILTFGNTEQRLAARPAHREYLKSLLDSGKLAASGPWVDESGALIIYEAADEAEVRKLMAADPYN